MTEAEFLRLSISTVVKATREEGYWVVENLDQFGGGSNVHGIRLLNSDQPKYGRITPTNYHIWQIVGKLN